MFNRKSQANPEQHDCCAEREPSANDLMRVSLHERRLSRLDEAEKRQAHLVEVTEGMARDLFQDMRTLIKDINLNPVCRTAAGQIALGTLHFMQGWATPLEADYQNDSDYDFDDE